MQIGCSSYVCWYVFWQYLRILLHTALSVNFVLGVNLALGDLALIIAKKTNHLYIHMRS